MGIASTVILGLVETGVSLVTGLVQNKQVSESQNEARALNEREFAESREARLTNEKLQKEQLALNKRQVSEQSKINRATLALKEAELGMTQDQYAREGFRNQVTRLTSIFESNENARNLYINRLRSLRRTA